MENGAPSLCQTPCTTLVLRGRFFFHFPEFTFLLPAKVVLQLLGFCFFGRKRKALSGRESHCPRSTLHVWTNSRLDGNRFLWHVCIQVFTERNQSVRSEIRTLNCQRGNLNSLPIVNVFVCQQSTFWRMKANETSLAKLQRTGTKIFSSLTSVRTFTRQQTPNVRVSNTVIDPSTQPHNKTRPTTCKRRKNMQNESAPSCVLKTWGMPYTYAAHIDRNVQTDVGSLYSRKHYISRHMIQVEPE